MTAREDFRAAVRSAATYAADEGTQGWLLTEAQFAAIDAAGDEYRAGALLSLAADLDRRANVPSSLSQRVRDAFRAAALMARRAAEGNRTDAESAAPVFLDAAGLKTALSASAADDCMEAGPE